MNVKTFIFLLTFVLSVTFGADTRYAGFYEELATGSVKYFESSEKPSFKRHDYSDIAEGHYNEKVDSTGWGELFIKTSPDATNEDQAYMAGALEGRLMTKRVYQMFRNIYMYNFGTTTTPSKILEFFRAQLEHVESQIARNPSDNVWKSTKYLINQTQGLTDGYNKARIPLGLPELDFFNVYIVNSAGDLEDLNGILNITGGNMLEKERLWLTDCSGLVKIVDGFEDIFVGQTTWRSYTAMLRTYKHYDFHFQGMNANAVSFSSSPGFISSKDDFYTMDNGLVTIETTNSIFTKKLYDKVTPKCLLCWQRTMIANRLATNGDEWTRYFEIENSGTYNNQWMVVDFNKFKAKTAPLDGFFYILEQIPGRCEIQDMTKTIVEQKYWPSYNIPYFQDIYNASGYYNKYVEKGDAYSYSRCPRARIFQRDEAKVNSLDAMKKIMQYNQYQTDPISDDNPANAIASRYDLRDVDAVAFGAIDSKVTSFSLMSEGKTGSNGWSRLAYAVSGPTKDDQPPFTWDGPWKDLVHDGQPDKFNFDWEYMIPKKTCYL